MNHPQGNFNRGDKGEKHDPLRDVGLTQEEQQAIKDITVLKNAALDIHRRRWDPKKMADFERYLHGDKFQKLSELAQTIAQALLNKARDLGKAVYSEVPTQGQHSSPTPHGRSGSASGHAPADPSVLGHPFHNPYTFIPFPDAKHAPKRISPTLLSVDETPEGKHRFTGVVDLEIRTLSPLLTCDPIPVKGQKGEHQTFKAMTCGPDVIVPASGIRGSLRSLMTILTGGTLDYVDDHLWLTQGRDLTLGPGGNSDRSHAFLGRIASIGATVELETGETRLVDIGSIERVRRDPPRPRQGQKVHYLWTDEPKQHSEKSCRISSVSNSQDASHCWQLKLSGRPINSKGKREGAFKGNGTRVEVPPGVWEDFKDRSRHADIKEFKVGDLVWIQHRDPNAAAPPKLGGEIASLQWARWGRIGQKLLDLIKKKFSHVMPDAWKSDGMVDMVSDLFGQVPMVERAARAFAARVRPENLVFEDCAQKIDRTTLAPLLQPHPGCVAFYRRNDNPDTISTTDPLRGYKVYRNTQERGADAPWHYQTQGVFSKGANQPDDPQQRINKTCDLLREGQTGRLRIACRGLTPRELAVLMLACTVDWRLGGGKPLGLGHCRVTRLNMIDEDGTRTEILTQLTEGYPPPASLPEPYASLVAQYKERVGWWHASQQPVLKLRYPRAVEENRQRVNRGGQVWFGRHAQPKKGTRDGGTSHAPGLERLGVTGELKQKAGTDQIAAQVLPLLDPTDPLADVLYGYDLFSAEVDRTLTGNRQTLHRKLEPFVPDPHGGDGRQHAHTPQGQNRESRIQEKHRRTQD